MDEVDTTVIGGSGESLKVEEEKVYTVCGGGGGAGCGGGGRWCFLPSADDQSSGE